MIKFTCDHCQTEKDYKLGEIKALEQQVREISGHSVCISCFTKYSSIDKEAKAFAEQKRQELEKDFFKEEPEEEKEVDDLIDETLKELE